MLAVDGSKRWDGGVVRDPSVGCVWRGLAEWVDMDMDIEMGILA